jgi:acyl-coenzyme A synthetase/AMP-(fatty) acid ligase
MDAQRELAQNPRAGFLWEREKLVEMSRAKRFRDPSVGLIKLTSGSTGRPRPLVFTDAQLLADGKQVTGTMAITSHDLNYALIPFGHSYGLGNLTIPLLAHGIPVVCGSVALPHAIAADFTRWQPTVFPGVPALWRALAASEVALASLRLGISAGAPLSAEVARDFSTRFGQRLHSFYGSSETGGIAYDRNGNGALNGDVGNAMRGVKLVELSGARLKVSSAAVFTHGSRQRVGNRGAWILPDRASLSASGRVVLLGRRGTTVKIAGRRLNLAEVAERIRQLPGVREVWVGVSEDAEPVLGAAVATERPVAELRMTLQTQMAAWKVPKRWLMLADFPLTPRGKTDGRALRSKVFRISAA